MTERHKIETVLDAQAVQFVWSVDALSLESLRTSYTFVGLDEYQEMMLRNVGEGMQVYWTEILERAHLASVTSIRRSRRWLAAVVSAANDNNALGFAAAYRGLMESCADSSTALTNVPMTLAGQYSAIAEALSARATSVTTCEEIEDQLIHYTHGRYIGRHEKASAPQSHISKSTSEYLKVFGEHRNSKLVSLYKQLSDLTHPGATSVWMWLRQLDERGSRYVLSPDQDEVIISNVLHLNEIMLELLMFAFNAPVLVLNTLNYFSVKELQTPQLLGWNLDDIPAWVLCRTELEAHGAKLRVSAD